MSDPVKPMTSLESVLESEDFQKKAAELLNMMSATQGRVKVALIAERQAHPTWLLDQILELHGEAVRMRHREYLMLAIIKAMLQMLDATTDQTTATIQAFNEGLKTQMDEYVKALQSHASKSAADALKAQLAVPLPSEGLLLPPGAR